MLRIVALVGALLFMGGMIWYILHADEIDMGKNNSDDNYTEDSLCRTYTNAYRTCHYSYWEQRCICKYR